MKWEYKSFETANHKTFSDDANEHGKEGWELVHLNNVSGVTVGFFKRPLDEKEPKK